MNLAACFGIVLCNTPLNSATREPSTFQVRNMASSQNRDRHIVQGMFLKQGVLGSLGSCWTLDHQVCGSCQFRCWAVFAGLLGAGQAKAGRSIVWASQNPRAQHYRLPKKGLKQAPDNPQFSRLWSVYAGWGCIAWGTTELCSKGLRFGA